MKFLVPVFFCLSLLSLATAQVPSVYDPVLDARERARIESERQMAKASLARDEEACYQRFAVNDCLREVRKRRRALLEELRRQEIILDDARRAHTAAEQLQRSEETAARRASQEAVEQRDEAERQNKERLERAQKKKAEQAARVHGPVPAASGTQAPAPVDDSAQRAAMQRAYEEKQKEALERKRAREKAKAEKGHPSGQPLPVPP